MASQMAALAAAAVQQQELASLNPQPQVPVSAYPDLDSPSTHHHPMHESTNYPLTGVEDQDQDHDIDIPYSPANPNSAAAKRPRVRPSRPSTSSSLTGVPSNKARLTPTQKNTNHKDAENKRRNAIRERFTELSELVPNAVGQERSEQVMLTKTKDFLQNSVTEIRKLEEEAVQRGLMPMYDAVGGPAEDEWGVRLKVTDYRGPGWGQPNMKAYEVSSARKQAKRAQGGGHGGGGDDDDGEGEEE